jgi:F-type H+-transporting ATPase subunit b
LFAASEPAGEDAKPAASPFSGTYADAAWTVFAFVALLAVLGKFAWKPMLNGLKAREEHIRKEISEAEQTNVQAKEKLDEYQHKLSGIHDEGRELVAGYEKKGQRKAKEIERQALDEAEQIKQNARHDIERASIEARQELLTTSGQMIIDLGREILGRAIDEQDNQRLIDQAVDKLKEHSAQQNHQENKNE